ncbi:accessory factor UbiK family protein [Endozoicomonas gorgoniicola]|uniref:Ubiquinone biosynthesis accessory factor UbiK n=1 Tax=Endozoicomonas gorgoniicola TaxID=1234144 RepID=A0ABT3N2M7_9GAMM|nr:accessory factor UbiK family protein [Endozoicomonas gorgoniicola]MCW7555893.1 accessory factor UbiK family protein [Endozoicomonas gorgoniicola]
MIDKAAIINNIASRAGQILSTEKSKTAEDIEHNIKALVSSTMTRFELVSQDEFDAQMAVLRHTRERLEALEKKVAELETALAEKPE